MTIEEQIREKLLSYGVTTPIEIDEESRQQILEALSSAEIDKVYIDNEGGLCIEYVGE